MNMKLDHLIPQTSGLACEEALEESPKQSSREILDRWADLPCKVGEQTWAVPRHATSGKVMEYLGHHFDFGPKQLCESFFVEIEKYGDASSLHRSAKRKIL